MSLRRRSRAVRRSTALLVAVLTLAGCTARGPGDAGAPPCPPDADGEALVDWVPFVVVDGQMYSTRYGEPGWSLEPDQVGDVVATVTCRIAEVGDPSFEPREGDAAYLLAGTELRRVRGRPTTEALTALEEGTWQLFEPVEDA